MTNNDLQNPTQKTKDRATRISKLAAVRNFTYFIESTPLYACNVLLWCRMNNKYHSQYHNLG